MGTGAVPASPLFSRAGDQWDLAPDSLRAPFRSCGVSADSEYLIADFRPFVWNDSIWMSHTIEITDHPQRMALSTLDVANQALRLEQIFEKRLVGNLSGLSGQEKNWGFFLEKDRLMIQYSTLPCTQIFTYAPQHPRHAREGFKKCYRDSAHHIRDHAFLDIEGSVHNSCNPILWDKKGHGPNEYLVMVHNRYNTITPGYNHWLVRLNAQTFEITHISDGIVFGAALHHSEGNFANVIIVGSIHLVKGRNGLDLLVMGGEGDTYAIHERISMDTVAWLNFRHLNITTADAQQ
ncbi:hypothetical protein WJX73_001190 [Symbiochloris irregularis]|uniref:Uncharacterized protein n=1 Tax=Symbiochloris irregularis TaxID=706552 RepID=A0AAW1NRU7_9CHLO